MPTSLPYPLGGPPPPEVNLPAAPLVRVLAQVRFPGILKIDSKDAVTDFQEAIREAYPLFDQQASQQVHMQVGMGEPIIRSAPANVWRFMDAEKNWRVSLATSVCSLECDKYSSRKDFLARLTNMLSAIERIFNPRLVVRIGLRYVNQVSGAPLQQIEKLVLSGSLGVTTPEMREHVLHHLAEAVFRVDEGEMLLRCGILPANATVDPGTLTPIPESSWILDIDVYSSTQRRFATSELDSAFQALAEREYAVFRFVTNDHFLVTYGGQLNA